jgi:GNAT superfamily N-acetyltransferase
MSITIRPVEERDAEDWAVLYAGYRDFYRLDADVSAVRRTWEWVLAGEHALFGLVACDESGALVGLANLRWFARPSTATLGLYLDDLYTSPQARGRGVGTALLERAAAIAGTTGASVVRWITASDNASARQVYDKVASATNWVTYDMTPGS